jgi:hypothetical protein
MMINYIFLYYIQGNLIKMTRSGAKKISDYCYLVTDQRYPQATLVSNHDLNRLIQGVEIQEKQVSLEEKQVSLESRPLEEVYLASVYLARIADRQHLSWTSSYLRDIPDLL